MHSPVDTYIGCFQFGAIFNKATINFHVQIFVWTHLFSSLEQIPGMEFLGHVVNLTYNFAKKMPMVDRLSDGPQLFQPPGIYALL